MEMTCPICMVELVEGGKCPKCQREWEADPDGNLRSKRRTVRLVKIPEPGDRLDEVIKPVG